MASDESFKETPDIETASDNYAQRFAGAVGKWFLEVQEEATLSMLDPYPGATVLDVGGGHGQTARALVENGYNLTILGSNEACERRVQTLVRRGLCKFEVGDIRNLPFPSESFDVVVSYRLLPHVTQWKQCLAEMARVARMAVVIDYPEFRSFNYVAPYFFHLKKKMEGNTRPYTCFHMDDILAVFEKKGFIHDEHYREFFMPMVLHRQIDKLKVSRLVEKGCRVLGLTDRWGSPVILKVTRI